MLEEYLVEVLLSAILMFNAGAYSFLWNETRRVEDDVDELDGEISDLSKSFRSMYERIFGSKDDDTMEGHLVETEKRFDLIDKKLEEICGKIEQSNKERKEEHNKVWEQMDNLISTLSEEENVNVEEEDIRVG